jgi:hypothetical protein
MARIRLAAFAKTCSYILMQAGRPSDGCEAFEPSFSHPNHSDITRFRGDIQTCTITGPAVEQKRKLHQNL